MITDKLNEIAEQEKCRQEKYEHRIFCCTSTACLSAGAGQTVSHLINAVDACKCDEYTAEVVKTGCMGLCSRGPLVRVESKGEEAILYGDVGTEIAQQIVAKHIPDRVKFCHIGILITLNFIRSIKGGTAVIQTCASKGYILCICK